MRSRRKKIPFVLLTSWVLVCLDRFFQRIESTRMIRDIRHGTILRSYHFLHYGRILHCTHGLSKCVRIVQDVIQLRIRESSPSVYLIEDHASHHLRALIRISHIWILFIIFVASVGEFIILLIISGLFIILLRILPYLQSIRILQS